MSPGDDSNNGRERRWLVFIEQVILSSWSLKLSLLNSFFGDYNFFLHFNMSLLQISLSSGFQSCTFQILAHLAKPLTTAHKSVCNYTSNRFSFQANWITRYTAQTSVHRVFTFANIQISQKGAVQLYYPFFPGALISYRPSVNQAKSWLWLSVDTRELPWGHSCRLGEERHYTKVQTQTLRQLLHETLLMCRGPTSAWQQICYYIWGWSAADEIVRNIQSLNMLPWDIKHF